MDQHLESLDRHAEQPVRFDHLQPLVHHGGGVDRDLASHNPVGVSASLVGRDVSERVNGARAEWAARGGQDDTRHAMAKLRGLLRQALENGVVLAIDR